MKKNGGGFGVVFEEKLGLKSGRSRESVGQKMVFVKRHFWKIFFAGILLVLGALLFPRWTRSNVTFDGLCLEGYAIKIPFGPIIEIGEWRAYYPSGALGARQSFWFGERREYKDYYPNGVLRRDWRWKNGKECGEWRAYHSNGNLKVITTFDEKTGQIVGQKIFSENGDVIFHSGREGIIVDKTKEFLEKKPPVPDRN